MAVCTEMVAMMANMYFLAATMAFNAKRAGHS
jgi:hypothetical protein